MTKNMSEEIAQHIARDLEVPGLPKLLADRLPGSDLHSLLLSVLKRRIAKIEPSQLKHPNAASQACDLDGRLLHKVERAGYESAAQFEAIELSPLNPLGTLGALTGLDQANALSTVRAFECTSDPTLGLAIESARRRQRPADRKGTTRLCTAQRVIRFPVPVKPGLRAHFKLFSLLSAARDVGSFAFEVAALREHIAVYLSLLSNLKPLGFIFGDIRVEISDTRAVAHLCSLSEIDRDEIRASVRANDPTSAERLLAKHPVNWPGRIARPSHELAAFNLPKHLLIQLHRLEEDVCAPLRAGHAGAHFEFNMRRLTGLGYYEGPCFHIALKNQCGEKYTLADGGFVDWTRRMLLDQKERLLTSAIGIELLCRMFERPQS
jgi:hypothetical protein